MKDNSNMSKFIGLARCKSGSLFSYSKKSRTHKQKASNLFDTKGSKGSLIEIEVPLKKTKLTGYLNKTMSRNYLDRSRSNNKSKYIGESTLREHSPDQTIQNIAPEESTLELQEILDLCKARTQVKRIYI